MRHGRRSARQPACPGTGGPSSRALDDDDDVYGDDAYGDVYGGEVYGEDYYVRDGYNHLDSRDEDTCDARSGCCCDH